MMEYIVDDVPPKHIQRKAIEIMQTLTSQQFKLLAMVVNHGKIISVEVNKPFKSHPQMARYNPKKNSHAEFLCIKHASEEKTEGSIMYVFRLLNKEPKFAMARPCSVCEMFIREAKIKKIIYSTSNGFGVMYV